MEPARHHHAAYEQQGLAQRVGQDLQPVAVRAAIHMEPDSSSRAKRQAILSALCCATSLSSHNPNNSVVVCERAAMLACKYQKLQVHCVDKERTTGGCCRIRFPPWHDWLRSLSGCEIAWSQQNRCLQV